MEPQRSSCSFQDSSSSDTQSAARRTSSCGRKEKFLYVHYFWAVLYLRAKCYHSFKKSEAPHNLRFTLCIVSGQVLHATCSCKAGKVGYCNHVLALMFKACKFSLFDSKATDDLCQDEDEQPDLACTSQLQKWHKKGRGDKISAQPVMEVTITKTKLDDTKSREGVKCLLYEARSNPSHDVEAERKFKETLKDINPEMRLALMGNDDSSLNHSVKTYNPFTPKLKHV